MECLIAWLQPKGTEWPEYNATVPEKEEHPDSTKGKVIADYNLDVDYEGSGPHNELNAQEEKEEDAEYAKMEIPHSRTFHQRIIH